jgi:hypothetical protein
MGSVGSAFKGLGSVFGLGNLNPQYQIKTDPDAVAAANRQANETADLSSQNTPSIEAGGSVSSASDTLASRRKKASSTSGVASNLGIGS